MVRFEVFVIDRGGGRTPKTLSPARGPASSFGKEFGADAQGTFATRAQADAFIKAKRIEFATSDTPVGARPVPTAVQAATAQRTRAGEEIIGPPPKGRRTTRTPAEEVRIRQKAATLALKNIREGRSFASKETIARLQTQEKSQKQFVEARILRQLREGTTLTEFKTFREIEIIKAKARIERARETRKAQLRTIGGEIIQKPSEKLFSLVPTGEGVTKVTDIPTETALIR